MISVEDHRKAMNEIFMRHHTEFVPQVNEQIMGKGVKRCKEILRDPRRRMPWDKTPEQEAEEHAEKVLLDVLKSEYQCRLAMSKYLLNQD